jgi:hypothetical protein
VHAIVGEDALGAEAAQLGLASVVESGDPDAISAAAEAIAAA